MVAFKGLPENINAMVAFKLRNNQLELKKCVSIFDSPPPSGPDYLYTPILSHHLTISLKNGELATHLTFHTI